MNMKLFSKFSLLTGFAFAACFAATAQANEYNAPRMEDVQVLEVALNDDGSIAAPSLAAATDTQDDSFDVARLDENTLDIERGTEGVKAETLASITSNSMNNDFNVIMNGVSNETLNSFNNFNGVANNVQVTGPGAQVQTNTTINIYMLSN